MAQKRKVPAKSKTSWSKKGKTNLKSKKKFSWKKFLPIIILISLVGGFFVWRSFAATKLYPYQYSVYQCSSFDKTKIDTKDDCFNESAEALTYRLYAGVLGRDPDPSGFKFWTQKLAGDRERPTRMATRMISGSKTAKSKSNRQFVAGLYAGALGRKNQSKGSLDAWQKRLDNKSWSRGKMAAHFANEDLSKRRKANEFANYIKKAPQVIIKENAKRKQEERLWTSAVRVNEAKKQYDGITRLTKDARNNRSVAGSHAKKSKPSKSDLKAIASNEKTVRKYLAKVPPVKKKITKWKNRNKALYVQAKKVSDYSPDLSSKDIKKNYEKVLFYEALTDNVYNGIKKVIKDISGSYKWSEGKYEAELRRIAAAQIAAIKAAQRDTRKNTCTYGTYSNGKCKPRRGGDPKCPAGYHFSGKGKKVCLKDNYVVKPTKSCYSGYSLYGQRGESCKHNTSGSITGVRYTCPAGYNKVSNTQCTFKGKGLVSPR
jgi:hypothetical protein